MVEKEVAPSLYAAEVVAKGPAALLRSQVPKAVQVGAFYSQLGHLFKGTQGTYPSPPGIRRAQLATSSFVLVWLPAVGAR